MSEQWRTEDYFKGGVLYLDAGRDAAPAPKKFAERGTPTFFFLPKKREKELSQFPRHGVEMSSYMTNISDKPKNKQKQNKTKQNKQKQQHFFHNPKGGGGGYVNPPLLRTRLCPSLLSTKKKRRKKRQLTIITIHVRFPTSYRESIFYFSLKMQDRGVTMISKMEGGGGGGASAKPLTAGTKGF